MPNDLPANRKHSHTPAEIDAFIERLTNSTPATRGRVIIALDATASRQPTWDMASALQAEMFREVASIGGLEVQLVYYRGVGECQASGWVTSSDVLTRAMSKITCETGITQIGRVLDHARCQHRVKKVSALVFVGDAMEESAGALVDAAIGLGFPAFMFQEGENGAVERAYREIARRTKGAFCRFDAGSAQQLRELLRAVAAFAAGGMTALANRRDAGAIKLLTQLRGS
jgi:hypothetical protein